MTAPAPATIAAELDDRLSVHFIAGVGLGEDSFEAKAFLRDAEKLRKVDPVAGSKALAEIFTLLGKEDDLRYWINNLHKLGNSPLADGVGATCLSNLGFFSEAAAIHARIAEDLSIVNRTIFLGIITASFAGVERSAAVARRAHMEFDMGTFATAQSATAVLARLGVGEQDLQKMLDVAGEVLRRHRLMWARQLPLIRLLNDDEDAALLYQLHVPVSPQEAVDLTSEAWLLMDERGISPPPGLAFSFIAEKV